MAIIAVPKQSNKMTNNFHRSTILGIIALFISLIVLTILIIVLSKIESIGENTSYSSLIIGALSTITTVLVGFQIVNIVQLDKRFDSLENGTKQTIKDAIIEQEQTSYESIKMAEQDAIGTALMMLSWSFLDKGEIDDAMRSLINSLRAFQQGRLNDLPLALNGYRS